MHAAIVCKVSQCGCSFETVPLYPAWCDAGWLRHGFSVAAFSSPGDAEEDTFEKVTIEAR